MKFILFILVSFLTLVDILSVAVAQVPVLMHHDSCLRYIPGSLLSISIQAPDTITLTAYETIPDTVFNRSLQAANDMEVVDSIQRSYLYAIHEWLKLADAVEARMKVTVSVENQAYYKRLWYYYESMAMLLSVECVNSIKQYLLR